MKKKGQGLTLNTIVIAALVIIVLIVLILIFTGNMGPFSREVNSCQSKGGVCRGGDKCPDGEMKLLWGTCKEANQICCIPEPKAKETSTTTR